MAFYFQMEYLDNIGILGCQKQEVNVLSKNDAHTSHWRYIVDHLAGTMNMELVGTKDAFEAM